MRDNAQRPPKPRTPTTPKAADLSNWYDTLHDSVEAVLLPKTYLAFKREWKWERNPQGGRQPAWEQSVTEVVDSLRIPQTNPGLLLNKLLPDPRYQKGNVRRAFLEKWSEQANHDVDTPGAKIAEALRQRQKAALAVLPGAACFEGGVVWRMIIGISSPNPLETSITLHPQYGFPLIPGSSVKGLTRAWCLLSLGEFLGVHPLPLEDYLKRKYRWKEEQDGGKGKRLPNTDDSTNQTPLELLEALLTATGTDDKTQEEQRKALFERLHSDQAVKLRGESIEEVFADDRAKHFLIVFGSTDNQGAVNFYDALPVWWKYQVDVMTPHYGDYYMDANSKTPPADWFEPKPITFLTLDAGTRFEFRLHSGDAQLAEIAVGWLRKAGSELGVGGKTMSGYGEIVRS